ncbi:UDP-N-acetylglucosamine transferase [compost metagenome]
MANKISKRFATKIFTTFEEAQKFFPQDKVKTTGSPIRAELLQGSKEVGYEFLGFDAHRPILTIMGGSLGAKKINDMIRANLPSLAAKYQIVHLCGKNNVDPNLCNVSGYKQYEYIHDELPHIMAATDIVITRGGSNAIFEFLALNIPMLIIPLGLNQSRGDQILNAESFQKKGYGFMLQEEDLNAETLLKGVQFLEDNREFIVSNMALATSTNAIPVLLEEIYKITGAK